MFQVCVLTFAIFGICRVATPEGNERQFKLCLCIIHYASQFQQGVVCFRQKLTAILLTCVLISLDMRYAVVKLVGNGVAWMMFRKGPRVLITHSVIRFSRDCLETLCGRLCRVGLR